MLYCWQILCISCRVPKCFLLISPWKLLRIPSHIFFSLTPSWSFEAICVYLNSQISLNGPTPLYYHTEKRVLSIHRFCCVVSNSIYVSSTRKAKFTWALSLDISKSRTFSVINAWPVTIIIIQFHVPCYICLWCTLQLFSSLSFSFHFPSKWKRQGVINVFSEISTEFLSQPHRWKIRSFNVLNLKI